MCSVDQPCVCREAWEHAWRFEQILRLELERELVERGAGPETIRIAHEQAHAAVGTRE